MSIVSSVYPVVQVTDPRAAADFFIDHFEFEQTFGADWYVSLRRGPYELAFLDSSHPTIPDGFRQPATGILLNVEVDDATAEYTRLVEEKELPVRLSLRDEAFGQRHFILEAPGRVLVDVIEEIPPSGEFAVAGAG